MHRVSTDASFRLVMLVSLSANEQVSQFLPELESGWSTLVGSDGKPKASLFSISKTQRRSSTEVWNKWNVVLLFR